MIKKLPQKNQPAIDSHQTIADLYKSKNPEEQHKMLNVDLHNWPEEAKQKFSQVAIDYKKHGLTPEDASKIWHASTGGTKFNSIDDRREFNKTVNRSMSPQQKTVSSGTIPKIRSVQKAVDYLKSITV